VKYWPERLLTVVCTNDMNSETDPLSSRGTSSMSFKKRSDTDRRASCGHSWNQSIDVQLTRAGNLRDLTRRVVPTGEKQRTTFNFRRTFSMKNFQQFSRESSWPVALTSFRTPLMTSSIWSSGKRPGISPDASKSLIKTRNSSWGTWASVMRNMTGWFLTPALMYCAPRSTFKSAIE